VSLPPRLRRRRPAAHAADEGTHGGGRTLAIGGTRGKFAAHIRAKSEKWARVIRASGATMD
jgi:hypothetical protein